MTSQLVIPKLIFHKWNQNAIKTTLETAESKDHSKATTRN